jgi:hypothetical protein
MPSCLFRVLLLAIVLLSSSPLWAQVSGANGRRLLLKTDLYHLLPIFATGPQVEAEFALLRRLSVALSYQRQRPTDFGQDLITTSGGLDDGQGSYLQQSLGFTLRYYRNPAFPAPRGQYLFIGWERGRVDFLNEDIDDVPQPIGPPAQRIYRLDVQAPYREIRFGWGQQLVYFSRMVVDMNVFITRTAVPLGDFLEYSENLSYVAGPTLLPLGERGLGEGKGYWCLGVKLAIGLLLI